MQKLAGWLDATWTRLESRTGLYVMALSLLGLYALYGSYQPAGLPAPGVYVFGLMVPASSALYLCLSATNHKQRLRALFTLAAVILIGALDMIRRAT